MNIDCELRKWVEHPHYRFDTQLLGRDDFGTWLGVLPPTPFTGPHGDGVWHHAFTICVPERDWWVASWNDKRDVNVEVYVDMTTPAEWLSTSHVSVVDLDLDVARLRDGRVDLLDSDEFDEHRMKYGYPQDVASEALASAERMMKAVQERIEPFDSVGRGWLERLLERE